MKIKDITGEFEAGIEELLWSDYQTDALYPASEQLPDQMSDDDYLTFVKHINDIVRHAKQQGIKDPRTAIDSYTGKIADDITGRYLPMRLH